MSAPEQGPGGQPRSPFAPADAGQPPDLRPAVESSARWVRVRFGGRIVAESRRTLLLRQYHRDPHLPTGHHLPTYYFPLRDVRREALVAEEAAGADGEVCWFSVRVGDRLARNAAWIVEAPPPSLAPLAGYVSFAWGRMDAWYEEEEQVFVHARDPHKRVDVMASSRHVRVVVAGQTVAESRRPHLLFETSLPTRYYLPPDDVRLDLLDPSGRRTHCPYKGVASYWTVRAGGRVAQDLVWSYQDPIPECPKIKGLMCFFNEHVDLHVDGELQPRPRTPWSSPEK
jgi:uncharacterized protein (DUF427 family)